MGVLSAGASISATAVTNQHLNAARVGQHARLAPPGEEERAREQEFMREVQSRRTPAADARASELARHGGRPLWDEAIERWRDEHNPLVGLAGEAVLRTAVAATNVVTWIAKQSVQRDRPFEADPHITTVGAAPADSSFPSAHTSTSAAAATVMGVLSPSRADDYRALAIEMGRSRMYVGAHYPSDVAAGDLLGRLVAGGVLGGFAGLAVGGVVGAVAGAGMLATGRGAGAASIGQVARAGGLSLARAGAIGALAGAVIVGTIATRPPTG